MPSNKSKNMVMVSSNTNNPNNSTHNKAPILHTTMRLLWIFTIFTMLFSVNFLETEMDRILLQDQQQQQQQQQQEPNPNYNSNNMMRGGGAVVSRELFQTNTLPSSTTTTTTTKLTTTITSNDNNNQNNCQENDNNDEINSSILAPPPPNPTTTTKTTSTNNTTSTTNRTTTTIMSHIFIPESAWTYGHRVVPDEEADLFLYPPPPSLNSTDHLWRYRSNGLYWKNNNNNNNNDDPLYTNYHLQVLEMKLQTQHHGTIVPKHVQQFQMFIYQQLQTANLTVLAELWYKSYTYTLEKTVYPLHDGTTYIVTGDIELMWLRDSCAQVNPYLPLLSQSTHLQALIEGLIRRQSLLILLDPYATSFRLFLDFDFVGKHTLTEWDFQSGRTIHVAMHNYELDNLAYHLRLCFLFHKYLPTEYRPFDKTWIQAIDAILALVEYEQDHSNSEYRYPELENNGKGTKVCNGSGLTWSAFRPSDDKSKYGYNIPGNMMMSVSLRQIAIVLRNLPNIITTTGGGGGEEEKSSSSLLSSRVDTAERLASELEHGIHTHGIVNHTKFGPIYAYEVDACGKYLLADDANIPSLLSMEYLEFTTKYDANNTIRDNTRKFVLSTSNPYYHEGTTSSATTTTTTTTKPVVFKGIGSPHTPGDYVWHLSLIMQILTSKDDDKMKAVLQMIVESATNGVLHEAFSVNNPKYFTRASFAWANSLFAEMIATKYKDIIRILGTTNKKNKNNNKKNSTHGIREAKKKTAPVTTTTTTTTATELDNILANDQNRAQLEALFEQSRLNSLIHEKRIFPPKQKNLEEANLNGKVAKQ